MNNIIVLDLGSYYIKVGYINENKPRYIIPSTVGRPRYLDLSKAICDRSHYYGDEAILKKGILSLKYPIENGLVQRWDEVEQIFDHIFNSQLKINTEDYSIIVLDSPINSNKNKEELVKIIFETFNFQSLYIGLQQELIFQSINNNGSLVHTGLVVDSGNDSTLIVPIINGLIVKDSITQLKLGGKHITDYLFKLLNENGNNKINLYDKNIVNQLKEIYGVISIDNIPQEQHQQIIIDLNLKLTDGSTIKFTNQVIYKSTELLFNPSLNQQQQHVNSIQQSIYETVMKFNQKEIQNHLFDNIILTGGNVKFNGFKERLKRELQQLSTSLNENITINITSTQDPLISSWLGGSLIQLSKFNSSCYTRLEYDQVGPSIIYSN